MPKKKHKQKDEAYTLTPKGCALAAAIDSGLIDDLYDEHFDVFWDIFVDLMKGHGYYKEKK